MVKEKYFHIIKKQIMEQESFKDINSGEINPMEEFIIDRCICVIKTVSWLYNFLYNCISNPMSILRNIYSKIEPGLIVGGVVLLLIYEAIRDSRLIQKIKKFFSRFIITDEEYTKFNSP